MSGGKPTKKRALKRKASRSEDEGEDSVKSASESGDDNDANEEDSDTGIDRANIIRDRFRARAKRVSYAESDEEDEAESKKVRLYCMYAAILLVAFCSSPCASVSFTAMNVRMS